MNGLRIPLIKVHTHSHDRVHTHSHTRPRVVSPFFLSIAHSSFPSHFFFPSHDLSHMLSHIGSSPGRAFSCSLLACNNYSISRQCVPWLCSWAVAAGGVQWRGECWEEEGGLVVTQGRWEGRGWCFWQQPTHSCPEEPRTGLMSSGWSLRKLLITWAHMDLLLCALSC